MRIQDILATGAPLQLVVDAMDEGTLLELERGDGAETSEGRVASVDTSGGDGEVSCFQGHFVALGQDGIAGSYQDGAQVILSSVRYRASI